MDTNERIDGHIYLDDLLEEAIENHNLPVEINYDGNDTGHISGIHTKGDFLAVLEDNDNDAMNTDSIVNYLINNYAPINYTRQLVVKNKDKCFVVTSVDHIEFDEFNLIEVYAEEII